MVRRALAARALADNILLLHLVLIDATAVDGDLLLHITIDRVILLNLLLA